MPFDATRRAGRAARRAGRRLRLPAPLLPRRARVSDWTVAVPRGVRHPWSDGATGFLVRTVGPMIAPGQRVLVVDCGAGLVPVMAASRDASVVAATANPKAAQATAANARKARVDVEVQLAERPGDVQGEGFDLVLLAAHRGLQDLDAFLAAAPSWLGERGRLVLVSEIDRPPAVLAAPPFGYRWVQLARSLSLLSPWIAHSLGWDREAARARRHAERGHRKSDPQRRREVHRRRWEGDGRAGVARDPLAADASSEEVTP